MIGARAVGHVIQTGGRPTLPERTPIGPLVALVMSLIFAVLTMFVALSRHEGVVDCDMKAPVWILVCTTLSAVMAIAFFGCSYAAGKKPTRAGKGTLLLIAVLLLVRGAQCSADVSRAERECKRD